MKEFPDLLDAIDPGLRNKEFVIGYVKDGKKKNKERLTFEEIQVQFRGMYTLASAYIGMGIIYENDKKDKQSVILHNRKTEIVFPDYG